MAQTEFDRQAEVTRLLLEGISSTHVSPAACYPSCPPPGPPTKLLHKEAGRELGSQNRW